MSILKKAEHQVIEELDRKYKKKLIRLSLRIIKDESLAEDIVQEVFIKFSKKLENLELTSSFYTYLYRMTVNRSIDEYRRKKRNGAKTALFHENICREAEDIDLILSIKKIVEELDEMYRLPILLIDYDGLSYEEGAKIAGLSLPAFRSRLIRGREILLKKIKVKEITYGM